MFAKWINWAVIGAALLGILLAGCAPGNAVKIGNDANGQKISIKPNQTLAIRLESNPTTGYGWEVAECDEAILKPLGEAEYEQAKPNQNLVGGGGWQTFQFRPEKTGQTRVKLIYHRPWEKDVEPLQTFEVQVSVE